ncbi:transcriptional regulator [Halostella sp. JP-L12]|uniref:helix-turn-helix domain-containing protein n=1 Tax=Halostella TaxID=1843185 RepID=UPI000EF75A30|nr:MULTISPECIES: helix-turn-helix transcriptional regulator [Halostella]NHN49658.1 transcriptional regulator [Halostella sp. JP-L12]
MSQPDAATGGVDRERERLRAVTQETRFALLQDLLGHPEGLPTLKELDYVNPSKSGSTIRGHLDALVDADVVERVELPPERRSRDLPHVFYGITDDARDFLDRHGLLRARETLREVYDAVEKTDDIRRYERAPRPER